MITATKAFASSDGRIHESLEAAQAAELEALFTDIDPNTPELAGGIARRILDNRERIMDTLTTTKRSRPARRLVNGFKSKRRGAAAATAVE